MTVNARQLEHAIVKLLSHPLEELEKIGERLKEESLKITPTLIKFANANEYLQKTEQELAVLAKYTLIDAPASVNPVEIVDYDRAAENKLVASLLYRHSHEPYKQIYAKIKNMTAAQKEKIIDNFSLEDISNKLKKSTNELKEKREDYKPAKCSVERTIGGIRGTYSSILSIRLLEEISFTAGIIKSDAPDAHKE